MVSQCLTKRMAFPYSNCRAEKSVAPLLAFRHNRHNVLTDGDDRLTNLELSTDAFL